MVSSKVVVKNPSGLHLRPAGILCKTAIEFRSKVTISLSDSDTTANAKSVLGVLGACVKTGDEILITCEGDDEEDALAVILKVVDEGLGEQLPD
jgi:phosphocarrier protein HPr